MVFLRNKAKSCIQNRGGSIILLIIKLQKIWKGGRSNMSDKATNKKVFVVNMEQSNKDDWCSEHYRNNEFEVEVKKRSENYEREVNKDMIRIQLLTIILTATSLLVNALSTSSTLFLNEGSRLSTWILYVIIAIVVVLNCIFAFRISRKIEKKHNL